MMHSRMSVLKSTSSIKGVGSTILSSAYNGALYRRCQWSSSSSLHSICHLVSFRLGKCSRDRANGEVGGILHCRPSTFCGFSFIIAVLHPSAAHFSVEACCLLMNVSTQASCAQL